MERGGDALILKVHFPPHVTKLIQFPSLKMTVAEAITFVLDREGNRIKGEDEEGTFGIFIPRWENDLVSGWLDSALSLYEYPLKNRVNIPFDTPLFLAPTLIFRLLVPSNH